MSVCCLSVRCKTVANVLCQTASLYQAAVLMQLCSATLAAAQKDNLL